MTEQAQVPITDAPYDIEAEDAIDAFVIAVDEHVGDDARCTAKRCGHAPASTVFVHGTCRAAACDECTAIVNELLRRSAHFGTELDCTTCGDDANPRDVRNYPI
ncbi:hypothetical protein [Demequina sp. SO4-18]|uniref:hypothetical protein n=1 Tax=Demequina sp. SO4-18 TaxID=3401026 RepID=UPI003B595A72